MRFWTQEEKAQIAEMLADGLSASEIGACLNVSRNAIVGIVSRDEGLKRIGFARSPGWPKARKVSWTAELYAQVIALRGEGYTYEQIAEKMGTTAGSISAACKRIATRQEGKRAGIGSGNHGVVAGTALKNRIKALRDAASAKASSGLKYPSTAFDAPDSIGLSLVDLRANQCRWPINDAALGKEHLFCGAKKHPADAYCEHHKAIAYRGRGQERSAA